MAGPFLAPPQGQTALRAPRVDEGADVLGNVAGNDPSVVGRIAQLLLKLREPVGTAMMAVGGGAPSPAAIGPFMGSVKLPSIPGKLRSAEIPLSTLHEGVEALIPSLVARTNAALGRSPLPVSVGALPPGTGGKTNTVRGGFLDFSDLPEWAQQALRYRSLHPEQGMYSTVQPTEIIINKENATPLVTLAHEYAHASRLPSHINALYRSNTGELVNRTLLPPKELMQGLRGESRGFVNLGVGQGIPVRDLHEVGVQSLINRLFAGGPSMRKTELLELARNSAIPGFEKAKTIADIGIPSGKRLTELRIAPSITSDEAALFNSLRVFEKLLRGRDPAGLEAASNILIQ